MQLIVPEILAEARGMTPAMSGTLCALGVALWLFGWRWHRFWIVAGITLAAGLLGLNAGRAAGGTQIMALGILVAVAAGMMALELAKVFAFVAGGCGAWLAVQWVFPQAQELWAVFLSGGLFGLLLYRLWTMLLTSLAGVLVASHAALLLLEAPLGFNAVNWVTANQAGAEWRRGGIGRARDSAPGRRRAGRGCEGRGLSRNWTTRPRPTPRHKPPVAKAKRPAMVAETARRQHQRLESQFRNAGRWPRPMA